MGRFKLRAWWQLKLTDEDSRSKKTVVDEQYKNLIPICSDNTEKDKCPEEDCKWDISKSTCRDQCQKYTSSRTCEKYSLCQFKDGICSDKPDLPDNGAQPPNPNPVEPQCSEYDMKNECTDSVLGCLWE